MTATVKISALPAGSALAGSEPIPMVQAGATVQNPASAFKTYLFGSPSANFVLAGPTSGGAAPPTFRALVAADIPSLSYDAAGAAAAAQSSAEAYAADASNLASGTVAQGRLPGGLVQEFGAAGVNCNASGDQATITLPASITKYRIANALAFDFSTTPGSSAAINIWTGAAATGTEVASYSGLTGATSPSVIVTGSAPASAQVLTAGALHVNVATPNGSALTASFTIQLVDLTGF